MDFEKSLTLTYFFLASSNLEDEIHFKGGRFVTCQKILNFGMLII